MINGKIFRLEKNDVANIIHRGGTILKTARSEEFRDCGRTGQKLMMRLSAYEIDACIAIGGNGTYTGAMVFSKEYDIPFIGLPGTIDNDIYGTDATIGFDTALNTAIEAVDKIRDTADSHNRLFFIEVMGRHTGFIALHTGIGSGAGGILLPELENDFERLIKALKKAATRKKLFSMVIVAEGDENGGAIEVAEKVRKEINSYETKVTIIGHLQRGGSPTCFDRVLASRLGYAAVEHLIAGKRNLALGIVNNIVVSNSFKRAITYDKQIDPTMVKMAEILSM